jgi:hypothetical protein
MTVKDSNSRDSSAPVGERFGRLTVVGLAGQYRSGTKVYLCRCDCGGEARTSLNHLRRGDVKSCGCLRAESIQKTARKNKVPMQGRRFGRLVVKEEAGRTRNGTVRWTCRCDCGNEVVVAGHSLRRREGTRSCGCLAREVTADRNKANRKDGWGVEHTAAKAHAKGRFRFDLSVGEFKMLVTSPCHYCGAPPSSEAHAARLREKGVLRGGIDRKDSSEGYTSENCVPCCARCNTAKMDARYDEFLEEVRRRYEHLTSTGLL